MKNRKHALIILIFFMVACPLFAQEVFLEFTPQMASHFAQLALKNLHREFPNKLSHVMNDSSEVLSPQTLHPAFYGCFDWHSSVHGHWMLVRLLRHFPALPEEAAIRQALNQSFTKEALEAEVAYLKQPGRKSFERTYGWAWLLKLAQELHEWDDPDARRWAGHLAPLAREFVNRYIDFLPRQTYPIRRGVHPNTAFGLAFALDYARSAGEETLEHVIIKACIRYYGKDENAPARWEPDGDDFLSPSLCEADLMRRIMPKNHYLKWIKNYLPNMKKGRPKNLFEPAKVSDRSDPKIVHLDGLNLSRAWCMRGIASVLPAGHPARDRLIISARKHAEATLPHIASGNYEGEHWLASFAVYMLTL